MKIKNLILAIIVISAFTVTGYTQEVEVEDYNLQERLLYKKVMEPDPYLEAAEKVRIYQELKNRYQNHPPYPYNNYEDNSVKIEGNNNQVIYNNYNNPVLQPLNPKPL